MPKMKGETNEEWMQRLRDFRKDRDDMMRHTRAAVGYINATNADDGLKLAGFLHLFHPEIPQDTAYQMVREQKQRRR